MKIICSSKVEKEIMEKMMTETSYCPFNSEYCFERKEKHVCPECVAKHTEFVIEDGEQE